MKTIIKNTLLGAAAAISASVLLSCNNLDDLEKRVDSLENRVTALENQVGTLNGNIETLYNLLGAGTIYSVTESDGVYTIVTSNGETLTLTQGAVGNTPLLSVDADGYWIVSYDNGSTYGRILADGQPVKASTVYPQFSVDSDGNWLISCDGGETFSPVLGADGGPATALGEGSDLFRDISYDESTGTLTIILTDGYTLEILVTPDFYCSINDVTYGTPVQFETGVTRTFYVTMHGVAAAFVAVPTGWSATIGDPSDEIAALKVTPPATMVSTKATADSDTDLSIFAVSEKGYGTIAKMRLYLSEAPVPADPSVTVVAGDATASTLSFIVTPNADVTSWKYIFQLSSEAAPTSEADFADAPTRTETTATTLSFSELKDETEYALYVLPINDDESVFGEVAGVKSSTTEIVFDTYYEKYMAGRDIVIGDRVYNYATYGEPTLIETSGELTGLSAEDVNLIFVNPGLSVNYTYTGSLYKFILIGNDPDRRSSVTTTLQMKLNHKNNADAEFVLFNIDLDPTGLNNYLCAHNADGAFDYFALVNCHVTGQTNAAKLLYLSSSARYFNTIRISDCDISIPASTSANHFINIGNSVTSTFDRIILENNVLYCTGNNTDFRIMTAQGVTVNEVVCRSNTLINISSTGIMRFGALNGVDVRKNLTYVASPTANFVFFRPTDTTNYTGLPSGTTCTDNVGYFGSGSYAWQWFFGGMSHVDGSGFTGGLEECTVLADDPFSGGTFDLGSGTFVPNDAYSSYGAQR